MAGKARDRAALLVKAMNRLEETCGTLEKSYNALHERAEVLRGELERKDKILAAFFANLPLGVILSSAGGKILYANRRVPGGKAGAGTPPGLKSVLGSRLAGKITGAGNRPLREETRAHKGKVWNVTAVPLSFGAGENEILVLLEDVTERAREREIAESRKRFQSIGETAAVVAHEIRNPLCSMELFADILRKRLENDPDSLRMLQRIRTGLANIERAVSNYLVFAKPKKLLRAPVDVGALAGETAEFCRPAAAVSEIEIKADLPDNITLHGDAQMIRQAFLNLAMNSMQAMPSGGVLSIKAKKGKGKVVVVFSDTGVGIKKKDLPRVFDPFFTTKANGAGLGLSIVQDIVTSHGGVVSVSSRPGKGAVFRMEFGENG